MTPVIADPVPTFRRYLDGTWRKRLPAGQAQREVQGWQTIRAHLPVAQLLRTIAHPGGEQTLVFEDVFGRRRCEQLLADVISRADQDPGTVPAVRALIDAVCDGLLQAWDDTGTVVPIGDCRPRLYATRLAEGGRLEAWYGHMPPLLVDTGTRSRILDVPGLLHQLRADLTPARECATALTQGDPTEPNIADPLCWLDYEHAGRNALAGESANLLWYLLAMGGWLVPTYKPITYAATVTLRRPSLPPLVSHFHAAPGTLEIAAHLRAGPGRAAAIATLIRRLQGDLGATFGPGDPMAHLRPWLAMRILGVFPLTAMSGQDRAVCLLKLADLADATLGDFATLISYETGTVANRTSTTPPASPDTWRQTPALTERTIP